MSRETLKDFLNSINGKQDRITYVIKDSPDGLGKEPGTGEELLDLNNDQTGLLGNYLNFLVDNSTNTYKIKPGNSKAASSNKGDQIPLADVQGSEKVFIEQGTVLKNKLNENSNSGYFNSSGTDLNTLIDKVGNNFSNHEKLKEIEGRDQGRYGNTLVNPEGEENDIVQATQKMFLKNNRFANVSNSASPSFTEMPQQAKDFEESQNGKNTVSYQNEFGKYNKDKVISLSSLKEIGTSLLLKASGFSDGDSPGKTGKNSDIIEQLESINSSFVNENSGFLKIAFSNLRSKYSKGFPEDSLGNSMRQGRGEVIENSSDANNFKTFGQTYNTEYNFTKKGHKRHKIEAALSLIALKSLGDNYHKILMDQLISVDKISLSSDGEKFIQKYPKGDPTLYMLGKSKELASLKINNFLFSKILTNTSHPLRDCIDEGFRIILGSDSLNEKGDINLEKSITSSQLSENPGFWLAIARSVLKSFDSLTASIVNTDTVGANELFNFYKGLIDSNKFIQFYNALAVMGDISLESKNGLVNQENNKHHRDTSGLNDNRALPGMGRKNFGLNQNELSWSQDEVPSMFIMPANVLRASLKLNNLVYGENPARGMFGSKLIKNTYAGVATDGSYNRIPNEVVKILEDRLDGEYVPFYIQDLRTNEIISFHAFLTSLNDTFNTNYSSTMGYGRMDAVKNFEGTTRTVKIDFTLFATNREDFDTMWYKINKITTLFYPQWTPGTMVYSGNSKFYQPFSQVMAGTPVVRLRVGDVIKSNYSRFNLARTFGIGDQGVDVGEIDLLKSNPFVDEKANDATSNNFIRNSRGIQEQTIKAFLTLAGSPHDLIEAAIDNIDVDSSLIKQTLKRAGKTSAIQLASNILVNGFANPLSVAEILGQLRDPNMDRENLISVGNQITNAVSTASRKIDSPINPLSSGYYSSGIANAFKKMLLKPNMNTGYYCDNDGTKYFIPRRINVRIQEKKVFFDDAKIRYKVKVIDTAAPTSLFGKELIVNHSDIFPEPGAMFNNSILGAVLIAGDPSGAIDYVMNLASDYAVSSGVGNSAVDFLRTLYSSDESKFMLPEINPYVRAINTTKGRGLAGVLTGLGFNFLENFPWEVDFNARAPIGVKLSFNLDVIHDIAPGLDHTGYNRAPLYNVGDIMRQISGDVYEDGGRQAEFNYKKEGSYGTSKSGIRG